MARIAKAPLEAGATAGARGHARQALERRSPYAAAADMDGAGAGAPRGRMLPENDRGRERERWRPETVVAGTPQREFVCSFDRYAVVL